MKVGFIGLGIMGAPMARNLAAAYHELIVLERLGLPEDIRSTAQVTANGRTLAAQADVVILMVPDTPDVEAVLFGEDGVAAGLQHGGLVVDMSSISPIATKRFAAKINALGCDYLDAPVSGGEVGAREATLSIMVGGPDAAFARAESLFNAMGRNVTHVGIENGAGQTCKVANQIIVALNILAVSEALVFASKAGADPAKVRDALMGGFASSRILEVHASRMLERKFAPGFRIRLHQKDIDIALSSARELGLALPSTAIAAQVLASCAGDGEADLDHSALVTAIERLASHRLWDDAPVR